MVSNQPDPVYTMFMGAGRDVARCELCWAAMHETKDSTWQPRFEPTWEFRLQSIKKSI